MENDQAVDRGQQIIEPDGIGLKGAEDFLFTTGLGENNYLEAALEKQKPPPRDPIE